MRVTPFALFSSDGPLGKFTHLWLVTFFPHMPPRLAEVWLEAISSRGLFWSPQSCGVLAVDGLTSPANSPCLRLNSPPPYNPGPQWGYTQMESCASSLPPGLPSTPHGCFSTKPCPSPSPLPGIHSWFSTCHHQARSLSHLLPGIPLPLPPWFPLAATLLAQAQRSSQEATSDLITRLRTKSSPSPWPLPKLQPHLPLWVPMFQPCQTICSLSCLRTCLFLPFSLMFLPPGSLPEPSNLG